MNNARYAINKYYILEELNVAFGEPIVQTLMEKFAVVRITKKIAGHQYVYQEVLSDGFNSYKDALDYIEVILELPERKNSLIGGQGYEGE